MKFSEVCDHQAHSEILEQICDAILRGELKKGDWLPPEREIAIQTRLSRTSVREAIKVLSEAGMVRIVPGRGGGTQMVKVSLPARLLGASIGDEREQLLEFYEARTIIETSAAALAAKRATPEQIEELEQVVEDMEKLVEENPEDYSTYLTIDAHFHRLVVQGSGNRVLFDTYLPILRQVMLVNEMINVMDLHPYSLPTMQRFLQAVKDHNPEAARSAIDAHVTPLASIIERNKPLS